ncbi:MAG: MaoC family dehydratase [Acidobacteria bacterium]|nr:MaoC family dehydratase [Acidobacteriota bacterium]
MNLEALEIGQEIGSRVFSFSRDSLVKYAGASGDFNPIHYRDDFAKSVGLEGVLAHGMLTMGAAVQVAVDWVGDSGKVIDYGVRFTKPVYVPADTVAEVIVVGKIGAIDLENRTVRVDLTASCLDVTVLGKAQAVVRF